MIKLVSTLILLTAITACVPYHAIDQDSDWGYKRMGYVERINADGSFYLEFHGNGYISNEEIIQNFNKRAAELCKNGFSSNPVILKKWETKFEKMKPCRLCSKVHPVAAGNVVCK